MNESNRKISIGFCEFNTENLPSSLKEKLNNAIACAKKSEDTAALQQLGVDLAEIFCPGMKDYLNKKQKAKPDSFIQRFDYYFTESFDLNHTQKNLIRDLLVLTIFYETSEKNLTKKEVAHHLKNFKIFSRQLHAFRNTFQLDSNPVNPRQDLIKKIMKTKADANYLTPVFLAKLKLHLLDLTKSDTAIFSEMLKDDQNKKNILNILKNYRVINDKKEKAILARIESLQHPQDQDDKKMLGDIIKEIKESKLKTRTISLINKNIQENQTDEDKLKAIRAILSKSIGYHKESWSGSWFRSHETNNFYMDLKNKLDEYLEIEKKSEIKTKYATHVNG